MWFGLFILCIFCYIARGHNKGTVHLTPCVLFADIWLGLCFHVYSYVVINRCVPCAIWTEHIDFVWFGISLIISENPVKSTLQDIIIWLDTNSGEKTDLLDVIRLCSLVSHRCCKKLSTSKGQNPAFIALL